MADSFNTPQSTTWSSPESPSARKAYGSHPDPCLSTQPVTEAPADCLQSPAAIADSASNWQSPATPLSSQDDPSPVLPQSSMRRVARGRVWDSEEEEDNHQAPPSSLNQAFKKAIQAFDEDVSLLPGQGTLPPPKAQETAGQSAG